MENTRLPRRPLPQDSVAGAAPLHRGCVVPIRPSVLSQHLGDPDEVIDLYRSREEAERIERVLADERRDLRSNRIRFWLAEHWPAIVFGTAVGLLAVATPAVVIAWVAF